VNLTELYVTMQKYINIPKTICGLSYNFILNVYQDFHSIHSFVMFQNFSEYI
jgi:hypothetical protein